MLYKPTNPYPYNSVVEKPTETTPLTFTASCVSTSDISSMRLNIKDNTTEYYLPIADGSLSQCKTTSGITIPYQSATFNSGDNYSIKTSNFTRTDGISSEAISKIVQSLTAMSKF